MAFTLPPQIIKAPALNNVALGKTATLEWPLDGRRVRRINFNIDATDAGGDLYGFINIVDEVRVKIGGRIVQVFTSAQLLAMVELNGAGFLIDTSLDGTGVINDAYQFTLPFAQDWRRTQTEADVLAWPTGGLLQRGVSVVVELVLKTSSTITLHGISATMEVDYPRDQNGNPVQMSSIWKTNRETINATAAGKFTWQHIPRIDQLYRLHFFSSRITEIEVFCENVPMYSLKKDENVEALKRRGFNPQANVFHVIFDRSQTLADFIPLEQVGQLRFDITHGSSGQPYEVVYELIGPASR